MIICLDSLARINSLKLDLKREEEEEEEEGKQEVGGCVIDFSFKPRTGAGTGVGVVGERSTNVLRRSCSHNLGRPCL